MDQVNYSVARSLIKSGDSISFFSSHEDSWFRKCATIPILYFTGSRIYHTGVAVWVQPEGASVPRLMVCEAVGTGRRLVNLSKYQDHKFEVHGLPTSCAGGAVVEYMLDGLGERYAFLDLFKIGLSEFTGVKLKRATSSQVCSQVAASAWIEGGYDRLAGSRLVSPGALRNELLAAGIPTFGVNPDASK